MTTVSARATIDHETEIASAVSSRDAVRKAVKAAGAVGAVGIFSPGIDEAGMSAIWIAMVVTIARHCDVKMERSTAVKIVATAVAGFSAYATGSKILSWSVIAVLHVIPMLTVPAAVGMNIALNSLFTYKLGRECIKRFSNTKITSDLLKLSWHLIPLPTPTELRDLRMLLTSS